MPSGFSLEEVSYIGVALEAPAETLANTPFSFVEQLSELLKNDTGGGAIYLGMYRVKDLERGCARLRLIASSQSLPSGIQAVVNDAKREGGTLRDKLRRAVDALDLGEIEDFDLFRTHTRKRGTHSPAASDETSAPPAQVSPASVAEKSNGRHAQSGAVLATMPAPPPEVVLHEAEDVETADAGDLETDDLDLGSDEADDLDLLAGEDDELDDDDDDDETEERTEERGEPPALNASSVPPSGAGPRGGLDTATFSKLADAFLETQSPSIRGRIARRLDEARGADDALARYHAGHAIKKIERDAPGAFEDALGDRAEPHAAKG
jgi:hypothetical protein